MDAKLLEEVKRGVQITLEVYDKLDISKYFHQPSASQESNASPPPLIEVTDSPTSDVPLISVMDNEPSSVKRSVNDQPVELYEGEFSQLSSKRSKSEVDQKIYMGGRYIVSYSNLRYDSSSSLMIRSSDMQPNTSSLIFDNPNKLVCFVLLIDCSHYASIVLFLFQRILISLLSALNVVVAFIELVLGAISMLLLILPTSGFVGNA